MSVKKRIKQFAESQSLTISAFEKSINTSNGYVNSISKSIGLDKINLIIEKYPELSLEWLLTGKGQMLNSPDDHNKKESEEIIAKDTYDKIKYLSVEEKLDFMIRQYEELKDKMDRLEDMISIIETKDSLSFGLIFDALNISQPKKAKNKIINSSQKQN